MATVRDLVEGSRVSQTLEGIEATRVFLVDNVGGATGAARIASALNASGIPSLYSYHPNLSDLQCYNKNAEPASGSSIRQMRVTCQYKQLDDDEVPQDDNPGTGGGTTPKKAQINIGSTVQTVQTTNDKDGKEIILGPVDVPQDDGSVKTYPEQTGIVNVQVPQTTIRFSERRPESPGGLAFAFVGKVNSTSFVGIPKGMVLCTRINGVSEDGGKTFKTDYEFQVNFYKWEAQVIYIDQDTGLPLEGATIDNKGKARVPIYDEIDFNVLNLI